MSRVSRESGSQLPPWDQAPYFQPPRETRFTTLGIGLTVAIANPSRFGLIFAAHGAGTVDVSTDRGVNVDFGIRIPSASVPIVFLHSDYGSLVNLEWFAALNGAAPALTVIEVFLSGWPGEQ